MHSKQTDNNLFHYFVFFIILKDFIGLMHSVFRYWKSLTKPVFKVLVIFRNVLSTEWVVREKLLTKLPPKMRNRLLSYDLAISVNQMISTNQISHFFIKEKKRGLKKIAGIGTHMWDIWFVCKMYKQLT